MSKCTLGDVGASETNDTRESEQVNGRERSVRKIRKKEDTCIFDEQGRRTEIGERIGAKS